MSKRRTIRVKTEVTQQLELFLQSQNWSVEKMEDASICRIKIPAGDGQLIGYAILGNTDFMFYPIAPDTVPADQYPNVIEYIFRINDHLWTHNFELDHITGQVRCKASFSFRDLPFTIQLVENTIHNTVDAILTYLPGLQAVLTKSKSPTEAEEIINQALPDTPPLAADDLYKKVTQFFDEEDWDYQAHSDSTNRITYSGTNRDAYFCYTTMLAAPQKFFVSVGLQGIIDSSRVPAVIEWATRMNYHLRLGYFNYDFIQNHLSFVNGVDFYGLIPDSNLLRNVIYPALTTADTYWPHLQRVIDGTASAEEALPIEIQQQEYGN